MHTPCPNASLSKAHGWGLHTIQKQQSVASTIIIFDIVKEELNTIQPHAPLIFNALPFLMAVYKQHKQSYQGVTNAFEIVYMNIAILVTLAIIETLEAFKSWVKKTINNYQSFFQCESLVYWIINSILQVT